MSSIYETLNDMQQLACYHTEGPLLILAGAGSGKTRVLTHRIAYLIEEKHVNPYNIMAITFTNKAAAEMRTRVNKIVGFGAEQVWVSTFHSACVRILRRYIDRIGFKNDFSIYDTDDSKKVIREIIKGLNLDSKMYRESSVLGKISDFKNKLMTTGDVASMAQKDFKLLNISRIYNEYQDTLYKNNALDFDDLIMMTVKLFRQLPEVLENYQERLQYIMVDEYQDTNAAQYKLVSLLAEGSGNLCVVGDEDQSIYRFRGATIENILSFEEQFGAEVIKLEQNYRSTATILKAANAVIANNTQHKDKNLWSDLGDGDKIRMDRFSTEQEEAMFITERILDGVKQGKKYADHVILYRNNAQSRTVETTLAKSGIPYKIIGGVRFYERKEIKDIIAYLCVLNNNYDEVRFGRIVNEPVRGIGAATLDELNRVVSGMGISYVQAMCESDSLPSLSRKAKVLVPLGETFSELSQHTDDISDGSLIDDILDRFGYREAMQRQGLEGEVRLENINELKSNMITFAKENEGAGLSEFLEQVALVSDMDSFEADDDKAVLMTMHSAKGLEFDTVFVVGAEENIFPGYRSQFDPMEIEEERRLAYVAITRAKRHLYFTCAKQRMLYGQTMRNKVSRFVVEIPSQYMAYDDHSAVTASAAARSAEQMKPRTSYLQQQQRSYRAGQREMEKRVENVSYAPGERVRHGVFGDGTVLSAKAMGGDWLLEIAFDDKGTKKVAAKFAKMTKI